MMPMTLMKNLLRNRKKKTASKEKRSVSGISYTLERKQITRLHLYVKPPYGEVLVTAPVTYTDSEIESFIISKADWIRKHAEKFRERPAQAKMALRYESGEVMYFWGKPYVLTVIEEPERKRSRLVLDPEPEFGVSREDLIEYTKAYRLKNMDPMPENDERGFAVLYVPFGSTEEQRASTVKKVYKDLLEHEAGKVLRFWSDWTGLNYSSWHSRYMKTRWGSLAIKDRRVTLNTRLAEKPPECLIYVALHEVAHVKEANHGPGFKKILDENMPSWRDVERILKR